MPHHEHELPPAAGQQAETAPNVSVNHQPASAEISSTPPSLPLEVGLITAHVYDHLSEHISQSTGVSSSACFLISWWVISTWFMVAFPVFPCLVLVGPAHEGLKILVVLKSLCRNAILLASWGRGDVCRLGSQSTSLISAPGLDKRTAALLGNLTMRDFGLMNKGYLLACAAPRAVYVGEKPVSIANSILVDVTSRVDVELENLQKEESEEGVYIRGILDTYAFATMSRVKQLAFRPKGLSPQQTVIANVIGSCMVDVTQPQDELIRQLRRKDEQTLADRADSESGLVIAATLRLCHQAKYDYMVSEIADEINGRFEAQGETTKFSCEKVGLRLRALGFVRKRNSAGKYLRGDYQTQRTLHELARMYGLKGTLNEQTDLHCPLCQQFELVL